MLRKAPALIIDAHNHPDWYGYSIEKQLQNMDMYGIDKAWVLSWECPLHEYDAFFRDKCGEHCFSEYGPIPFTACLAYKKEAPDRFVLGFAPDPRRPESLDRFVAAVELYDVKICGELKLRMMCDNFDAIQLYNFCGDRGIPVVVHIDNPITSQNKAWPGWWYAGGIDAFDRAVSQCPKTNFIGHAPGFWSLISGDGLHNKEIYPNGKVLPGGKVVDMLRKNKNLYCDISAQSGYNALSRDLGFARTFLEEFQDRVLYARDYFDNGHQQLLYSLNLSKEVLEKILYLNAQKLIG